MTPRERKKLAKRLAARLKREGNPYCPYAPLVSTPRSFSALDWRWYQRELARSREAMRPILEAMWRQWLSTFPAGVLTALGSEERNGRTEVTFRYQPAHSEPPAITIPDGPPDFAPLAPDPTPAYAEMLQQFHDALYRSLGIPPGLLLAGGEKEPPAPEEPLTLPELKAALGGDGADLERRAFTQEGGIRDAKDDGDV